MTSLDEFTINESKRTSALHKLYEECPPKNELTAQLRDTLYKGTMYVQMPYSVFKDNIVNGKYNRKVSDRRVAKVKSGLVSIYDTYGTPFFNVEPICVNVVSGDICNGGTRKRALELANLREEIKGDFMVPVFLMASSLSKEGEFERDRHKLPKSWTKGEDLDVAQKKNDDVREFRKWAATEKVLNLGHDTAIKLATVAVWGKERMNYLTSPDFKFTPEDAINGHKRCEEIFFISRILNNIKDATHLVALAKAWEEIKWEYSYNVWKAYLNKTTKTLRGKYSNGTSKDDFNTFLCIVSDRIRKDMR